MSALTQSPEWKALESHASNMRRAQLRDLFRDPSRFEEMSQELPELGLLLDYSKNIATTETLSLLRDLAASAGMTEAAQRMFSGEKINWTEDRAVLHVALRNRSNRPIHVDGQDVMPQINAQSTVAKNALYGLCALTSNHVLRSSPQCFRHESLIASNALTQSITRINTPALPPIASNRKIKSIPALLSGF